MIQNTELARLRFHCRRGMKELDDLLLAFFTQRFTSLNEQQQANFSALLSREDTELWDWLVVRQAIVPESFSEIVNLINKYHATA